MTAAEYQQKYLKSGANGRMDAHRALIGAERALAKEVAPIYYHHLMVVEIPGTSLATTGEYEIYNAAWETTHLDDATVQALSPRKR